MKPFASECQVTKTLRLNYLLHLPPADEAGPDGRLPLILFLHGYGESGDDLDDVASQGLPAYIARHPEFPFLTAAPQCPWGSWWPEQADSLDLLLDELIATYPVDLRRIYLTGLSMGGYGAWYLGARRPERFAAVVPICGGGYWFHGFPDHVTTLRDVPVWAFHGAKDQVVALRESEMLVERLQKAGGNVRFTVYPEADHDSWTATYNNPELYAWLMQQRRA